MNSALNWLAGIALLASVPLSAAADTGAAPWMRDRGAGIRTSMFGSYVQRGELLIYPFYEFYRDNDLQYSPVEYGGVGIQDLEGRYRAHEGILFLGYGITDRLGIEMEAAVISATFEKDPADTYGTPARIEESGVGDIEGQLTYRWLKENEKQPELFSFVEAVVPHAKTKPLIGTEDWELKLGTGAYRGFAFGTLVVSAVAEYIKASETPWDFGEWQLGYVRGISPAWRVYAGVEGQGTDEASLITEAQRKLTRAATLKINLGVGLTSNSTDLAPEVGILFSLPTGR
ncbi:MAG: hypothetical protein ACRENJ_03705 [Candidatus Eiseniibacteriota bacterium]